MEELLKQDASLELQFAGDGAEALELLAAAAPALVVTDLVMPKLDGLQLVEAVNRDHPLVPVILVTGKGNEEIAVRALEQGAASYVTKRMLAYDLLDMVQKVLTVSGRRRSHTRLLGSMTVSNCSFALENDVALFMPLVAYLQDRVAQAGICDQGGRTRVGIALDEALTNAMFRGNLEVGSELRGHDDAQYHKLLDSRRQQRPYSDRRVYVEANFSRDEAVFIIRDEGPGFDLESLPDPTDPMNLDKPSGRGILLMRTFMDKAVHNDSGNQVTLIKRRDPRS